ncbi:hypothetical protein MKS88_003857 [Plasmodium brasilianum]|uniref:Uncharacterized protein n=1 Tax=Plasmodium brasilianum TaxID=5824 RepID=A0ACB9Y8L9_PLABR|nr:hypothetical protein MKS88_003857 [Plasmodium brasilianum]
MKDPEYNMITHTIEVNCLSDNHSTILYKCLSSDESLKHNGIELQSNTCEDIRYKAKNIYDYLQFFFKTIETFV